MENQARNDIDVLIGEHYVPSELERKKSLMMYVIRGILLALSQGKASRYEQFHLKQSLGRWTMFFLLLIPALVLSFVPYIKVLPWLAYLLLLAVWVIFFMQAWKGTYTSFEQNKAFLPVFVGFGGWVLSIFDMQLVSPDGSIEEYSSEEVVANEIAQNNETPQDAPNASTETQPEQIQQQPEQTTQVEQPQEAQTENPQN